MQHRMLSFFFGGFTGSDCPVRWTFFFGRGVRQRFFFAEDGFFFVEGVTDGRFFLAAGVAAETVVDASVFRGRLVDDAEGVLFFDDGVAAVI